ncbi:hypothetical protein JHK86_035594 [Glycine max]|nr:hypothetical protein JHK86_035594 [Glycine max]
MHGGSKLMFFFFKFISYLGCLHEQEFTKLVLHEYKTTTNMSEQFSPLVAIAQNPGKIRDDALVDFCGKLLHHFLFYFQDCDG